MQTLNRWNQWISKGISAISGLLLAVMVGVTFYQVIIRLLRGALPWSEEAARYMQVYLAFLGVSVGIQRRELVSVEALYIKLPKPLQKAVDWFVTLLIAGIALLLMIYGWQLVQMTLVQRSPVLSIKMGYVYMAVVVGSALMVLHSMIHILNGITGYQPPSDTLLQEEQEV